MPLPVLVETERGVVDVDGIVALVVLHLYHDNLLDLDVGVAQVV